MLYEVMRYLRNFFVVPDGIQHSTFEISNGSMTISGATAGQYILIDGSLFNDGVYQYPLSGLIDEEFEGTVALLAVPSAFLNKVAEIEEWKEKNAAVQTPYQSESFGGYSYTRATNSEGNAVGWQDAFKSDLRIWKKL